MSQFVAVTAGATWLMIGPMPPLAEIALELACAIDEVDLHKCCFALELEAMAAGATRSRLLVLAARVGLSEDATRKLLDHYERRAELMKAAERVIRGLIRSPARPSPTVCDEDEWRIRCPTLAHLWSDAVPG
jgi:hypothetical protein